MHFSKNVNLTVNVVSVGLLAGASGLMVITKNILDNPFLLFPFFFFSFLFFQIVGYRFVSLKIVLILFSFDSILVKIFFTIYFHFR